MAEDTVRAGEQSDGQTRKLVVSEYVTVDGLMEEPGEVVLQVLDRGGGEVQA